MMDNSSHGIAFFPTDNSVEVIPKSWVIQDGEKAYYPPHGTKSVKKLVKRGDDPSLEWPLFDVKVYKWFGMLNIIIEHLKVSVNAFTILKHFIDNYESARKRLPDAVNNSDLSSAETTGRNKSILPSLPPHPAQTFEMIEFDRNDIVGQEIQFTLNEPSSEINSVRDSPAVLETDFSTTSVTVGHAAVVYDDSGSVKLT